MIQAEIRVMCFEDGSNTGSYWKLKKTKEMYQSLQKVLTDTLT